MIAVKESRELIPVYKKLDLYRSEWMVQADWPKRKWEFVPIEYVTPSNKKYWKRGYWIRYIKKKDLAKYL